MALDRRRTEMASKKHKPEEAVAKLRQVDVLVSQGQAVAEAIRAIGVTEVTYYRLDFAHFTGLRGQARIQKAGSEAMKSSASSMPKLAPNGPAGPQAPRRRQSTSTRSPGGSGLRRATGAPVRVEISE